MHPSCSSIHRIPFLHSHPMHPSCSYIHIPCMHPVLTFAEKPCMHPVLTVTETSASILFLHTNTAMLRSYTTPHYQAGQESQHMKHVSMKVSEWLRNYHWHVEPWNFSKLIHGTCKRAWAWSELVCSMEKRESLLTWVMSGEKGW